ncbi:Ig domain-containing protein [Prevotella sp. E13-27]|uniref:Ig-like domain-containing protein n=1 Tax=Prevotella sp. E13-27 TaxID=2938122 RepID=UPI002009E58A|nr:Ig-like domain-containing protein [Prevotella sp. E13-27]MCK8622243.1 Ig-like domain-containing protein [Prevotella sp. E13-27]
MKKTLLLKTMLLLWALIVGSLSVWADEVTLWSEDFSSYSANAIPSGGTYNYSCGGANTKIYDEYLAGGAAPELLLQKSSNGTFTATIPLENIEGDLTLTFKTNNQKIKVETTTEGLTGSLEEKASGTHTATFKGVTTSTTSITIKFTCSGSSNVRLDDIELKGTQVSSGDTPTLKDCDLALTDAPIALNFDLYNNSSAQVINYTTSSTGAVAIAESDYATFSINESSKTITVTPKAVTPSAQTITVNQAADDNYEAGSTTFTLNITDSTPIPTYTATFSVNGDTTSQNYEEGAAIAFPDDPADINGKTFVGWTTTAIDGTTNDAPDFVTSANMGNSDITFYAVFASESGSSSVVDELDYDWAGVSGTSYTDWSGKNATSSAVYAGNTAGGNKSIQLRSSGSNSGIVSTTSGGKVAKVVVEWNSNTAAGRKIDIYGKNTPYSKADSLYNVKYQGTKLGSITTSQTELIVEGDYAYVGIRSYNSALYLDKLYITWSTCGVSYSDYCTTVAAAVAVTGVSVDATASVNVGETTTLTATVSPDDATNKNVTWTSSDEAIATVDANGVVTGVAAGEATITVTSVADNNKKATCIVTVTTVAVTGVSVDATASVNVGETTILTATVSPANATNKNVTWTSSDEAIATVDANGVVTGVAAGEVTITVTSVEDNTKTATCTVTVSVAPGTENNPYTVAQAIEATPSSGTSSNVYIHGFVSAFYAKDIMSDGSNYRYYISDDGTTDNQLLVYRGKGLNNVTFNSADDLQIGDEVVIIGGLTTYYGTEEVASGNYIVSLDRPVSTEPSVDVSTNSIEATAAGANGSIEVTYNNITDVVSEVFFCDAEGNAADYDWVVAEINKSHNLDYVISENTTESARTAYLKVHALDDEANDVYSELITISQAKPVVMNTYTLATSVVPGRHYLIVGNYQSYKKALASQNTNNRGTVDITLNDATASVESEAGAREILISVDENTGYFTLYDEVEEGYLYAACGTGTGNYLKTEKKLDDVGYGLWTISIDNDGIATIKATNGDRNWLRYNNGSEVFSCYASGQKDVYLYERDGDTGSQTVDVNIASACTDNEGYYYGTFSAPYSFIAPADITVSEIGIDEAGKLDVQAYGIEDVVPANTGVMISSTTSGSHTLTVVAGNGTSVMRDGNRLRATGNEGITATAMNEADPDCVFYRLTMHNKTDLGFYWGAAEGAAFDVVANKAYLAVPKSAGARIQGFSFEDGVITGIRNITPALSEGEGAIFDLQGRRVAKPVNGLYIVNGKKIVIK